MITRTAITLAALLAASAAPAGPLSPPPGPPAPSGPSLTNLADLDPLFDQVDDLRQNAEELRTLEPRTNVLTLPGDAFNAYIISEPGSYYLGADILVEDDEVTGVLIDADHVTLDLNGHTIASTATADNGAIPGPWGVATNGSQINVTVRNGAVSGFASGQVRLSGFIARAENLSVSGGDGIGMSVNGRSAMIIGCEAADIGGSNLSFTTGTFYANIIAENTARNSPNISFSLPPGAAVRDCASASNTFNVAYITRQASVFRRCTSTGSAGGGFRYSSYGAGSVYADCTVLSPSSFGFITQLSTVVGCRVEGAGSNGFQLRARNNVYRCTALDSDDDGFFIESLGNRVEECHAESVGAIPANYGFRTDNSANGCFIVRNTAVNAFDTFNNGAIDPTTIFASDWFNVLQAGPWDNLSQ